MPEPAVARVAMIFTGGTISMEPDEAMGGNRPVLDGAAILARAPEVAAIAQIDPIDWGLVPASHLRFGQLIEIAQLIAGQLERQEIDGVVVVQGTDSIEETAFAFQLLVDPRKPVIVTGAMRDAMSGEYDGPRNLADAVRCAAAPELRGLGVQVVLDGLVVAATDVVKTHTTALDTFQPRTGAPTGRVLSGSVVLEPGARPRQPGLGTMPGAAIEDVHLLTVVTGMDGSLVRLLGAQRPAGLVVAATGSGNTGPDLLQAAQELMGAGTVVALTTRCPTGTVAPGYAFPGGGATWQRAGALLSVHDGPKTRVAVALGLAAGLDRERLAALLGAPAA